MREIAASFIAALADAKLKLAEIYDLTLADGTIYRLTTHSKDIIWNAAGDTYTHYPMAREPANFTTNFESGGLIVALANITGALADDVQKNILEAAVLKLRRIPWNETYAADMEMLIYQGLVDVEFDRQVLMLEVRSKTNLLGRKLPGQTYQEPCNHRLFDDNCGLTKANYEYSGIATGGSRTTLIDTTRGTIYKVAFDGGDSSLPFSAGDTITGGVGGGTAVVLHIVYLTATTGFLWYVEQSGAQFVDDEELTG
jgi:hypothetical protein